MLQQHTHCLPIPSCRRGMKRRILHSIVRSRLHIRTLRDQRFHQRPAGRKSTPDAAASTRHGYRI